MKIKVVTTVSNPNDEGFLKFKQSLEKFNWEYDVMTHYEAYGSKQLNAYNYAKQTDCSHLFILDAYDVIVLGTMEEALSKIKNYSSIFFNAEKAVYPYSEWEKEYPMENSEWRYLNGGACFVEVPLYIKMFEEFPIKDRDNDQANLARIYLDCRDRFNFKLDVNCNVFQSIAFEAEDDFSYKNNRLHNNKTNTIPVIIHGNGKTDMSKIYSLM